MAYLSEICRQVLTISGLSLFLEVWLPSGGMKKCTRFIMGLLLVAVMLNPLLGLADRLVPEVTASVFADFGAGHDDNTQQIVAAGSELSGRSYVRAAEGLTADLERQIGALVSIREGVEDCRVQVELNDGLLGGKDLDYSTGNGSNNWGQVIIVLTVAEDKVGEIEQIRDGVRQTVAAFYDIEPENIQVSIASYT
jgi:stage III sporulation protein AF